MQGSYLYKVKGITCLFHRVEDPFLFPTKDLFLIPNRISYVKMTWMERNDVSEGSFKLDHTLFIIYHYEL